MRAEDFDLLGEVGHDTINSVMYWLDYDGEIGKDIKEQITSIPQGHLMTENNRPLYEAAIENNNYTFARIFIDNGNYDVRLFAIAITQGPTFDDSEIFLLNTVFKCKKAEIDLSTFIAFLNDLFHMLEEKYILLDTLEEKKQFLRKIKPYIAGIRIPLEFRKDFRIIEITKMDIYSWQKELRYQKL